MKRRIAREKAIQTLYQVDIAKSDWQEAMNNVLEDEQSDPFLERNVAGVMQHLADINETISQSLHNWRLERLAHIDRAILRLAVYELRYTYDTPKQVVINEAVELAKAFGTDQSSKFINGILANVLKQGEVQHGDTGDCYK